MANFSTAILVIAILQLFIIARHECSGISCFTCASRNSSNTDCEDPFNSTVASYTERCKVPKRGRDGEFPAHFCVKMIGVSYKTNEKLTVRRCVLENMDTQCGEFHMKDEDERFKGCILTCAVDGCNSSNTQYPSSKCIVLMISLLTIFVFTPPSSTLSKSNYSVSQENQTEFTQNSTGSDNAENLYAIGLINYSEGWKTRINYKLGI